MKKNSSQLWDKVWTDPGLATQAELILANERASRRWQIIQQRVTNIYQSFEKLSVIELGCGTGSYGAIFAKLGSTVTLLDYSKQALKQSKKFYHQNKLEAKWFEADALKMPPSLLNTFDISLSVGLAEHFTDALRLQIFQAHLNLLKPNGLAILIVPNAYNPPYRLFKFITTATKRWQFGEEYPFTRNELRQIGQSLKATVIAIKGDELYSSIKFLLPANFLRRFFKVGLPKTIAGVRHEKPSLLDDYFAYNFIVVLQKTANSK